MKKCILVVAAHPDDEVLGCGATIAKLSCGGSRVYTLILGEGATSRPGDAGAASKVSALKKQALAANKKLGVKKVYFRDLPDNRFDSLPLLELVQAVEQVKDEIKPDVIFTHHAHDLNVDHRLTYSAVITAARPLSGEPVKEIYSFEVLSSTEWSFPVSFSPHIFEDVTGFLGKKTAAMSLYRSEIRKNGHPRSLEGIRCLARIRGLQAGINCAEAFECVRMIR